jgi:hypothetical protein
VHRGRSRILARILARVLPAVLVLAGLAGCEPVPAPVPPPAPAAPAAAPAAPAPATRSRASLELERYYARVQADLLAQGLLRTDGGGPDTPFDARVLAENFERIALYDEYVARAGALVAEQTPSRLRRWEAPVRMQLRFGDSVPEARRAHDRAALARYAQRLSRATGHPVSAVGSGGNFHVLVLNEDERQGFGPELRRLVPGIGDTAVRTIETMPRSTFCLVFAFSQGSSSTYTGAVAVIRGEHPDLMRLSCLQEELAQGLGLANDSPRARPSIFNDDEEFALLTTQDEYLLRILYDRRLAAGMTPDQARPIVRAIAEDLLPGPS